MPQSAADIVAKARAEYTAAGGGKMSPAPAKPATASAKPATVKPASAPAKQPTTMDELKARQANIDAVKGSLPKLHQGGPVPADGAYQLKAGEHVLTASEAAKARKHALIHAGMKSLAQRAQRPQEDEAAPAAKPEKKAKPAVMKGKSDPSKKISLKK